MSYTYITMHVYPFTVMHAMFTILTQVLVTKQGTVKLLTLKMVDNNNKKYVLPCSCYKNLY